MRNAQSWFLLVVFSLASFFGDISARAFDLSNGLMVAVPAPKGPPALDGSDTGWDLSGAEPVWMSTQLAKQLHGTLALNYDDEHLYVYAKVSLPGRKIVNRNGPADPYWAGDCLELRLCSDPSLPRPLNMQNPKMQTSKQVCHISMWKDSNDRKDFICIQYGGMHGGSQGKAFNPPGSKIVVTETENQYVVQAVLPWSALNVPDGKNPFNVGERMTAIFGLHWLTPTQFYSVNAVYAQNPGDFAFLNWQTWGQVEFSPAGSLKPRHKTMEEALAVTEAAPVGVPITIDVPDEGKLSVNILGEKGEVIRDLIGGQPVKAGKFTTYWDGLDQWGFAQTPGKYRWAAYFSHGLKTKLVGFVGSSGNPPYPTEDGKGGWGGDEGVPIAVAADESGIYFGWNAAEAQRQIVKIDYAGNTLWRKSPFIQGGYTSFNAITSNGKYLFGVYSDEHPVLTRLDPTTGLFALFGGEMGKGGSVPIAPGPVIAPPPGSHPTNDLVTGIPNKAFGVDHYIEPECLGIAATVNEVFVSVYSKDIIQVLDVESGQPTRTLPCPAPRGLALDAKGNLYAVTYGAKQPPQVVRFDEVQGTAKQVITSGLVSPMGVAVDATNQITVTDEGASQQIKTFSPDGKLIRTLGKKGGRTRAGTYDPTSYRIPSAIVADKQGGLVVAESSIPKIFNRFDAASGKTLSRWFGWPHYGVANFPDVDDPMTCYYPFLPDGLGRATAPAKGGTGMPTAYWDSEMAGMEGVGKLIWRNNIPFVSRLANGRKYLISDSNPHAVCLIKGDDLLPVGNIDVWTPNFHRLPDGSRPNKPCTISVWIDRNGDHKPQPEEMTAITDVEGKTLVPMQDQMSSMWLDRDGNAFLLTEANKILKIPAAGFEKNGAIRWNPAKASYIINGIIPSLLDHSIGGRQGIAGVRTDKDGNIYTCLSSVVPALTPALEAKIKAMYPEVPPSKWCAYANPEMAKKLSEGLGHTAESNIAKFAKYSPEGKLIWMAGRKATAAAKPGEIYHFWTIGGMIGDNYISGCSEWGPISFYTSDGFYVDTIMNDPGSIPPAEPYTFSSENFAGRVQSFTKLGKVYAYDQGGIYAIDSFDKNLKVAGERRLYGTVELDKVYETAEMPTPMATSLNIAPISGDISQDSTWASMPKSTLMLGSATLAMAQIGYDKENLYAKFHVVDNTPLQNGGDDPNVVFKSGDVVGLDLGPGGDRSKPGPMLGDLRILAAKLKGQSRLIAMKPLSAQEKKPQSYFTPASGTKPFDFVGDIPGGKIVLTPDADGRGYTALMTVPRNFLEFPLAPGTQLKGDVEVLLSGMKSQGLQAASRNWLLSGGHSETTMTDDIPTEAWLYPQYWGDVSVK